MKGPRLLLGWSLATAMLVVWLANRGLERPGPAAPAQPAETARNTGVSGRGSEYAPYFQAPGSSGKPVLQMSVEEKSRLAQELRGLTGPNLEERLVQLWRTEGDLGEADLAWRLLVPKLQTELAEADKAPLYGKLEALLSGAELKLAQKAELIQMLGRAATPEALGILIRMAKADSEPALRPVVQKMIGGTGEVHWGGRFHEELSPILEQAWAEAEGLAGLQESLARALAGVGAPGGIELLFREALKGGATVREFSAQEDDMTWHVVDVFRQVRNPDAVPLLAERLRDQPLEDMELVLSGTSLAAMGRPEATLALLGWAEGAQREMGALLEEWFSAVRDPDSLSLLEESVATPGRFQERANWESLDRALQEWHESRAISTSGQGE